MTEQGSKKETGTRKGKRVVRRKEKSTGWESTEVVDQTKEVLGKIFSGIKEIRKEQEELKKYVKANFHSLRREVRSLQEAVDKAWEPETESEVEEYKEVIEDAEEELGQLEEEEVTDLGGYQYVDTRNREWARFLESPVTTRGSSEKSEESELGSEEENEEENKKVIRQKRKRDESEDSGRSTESSTEDSEEGRDSDDGERWPKKPRHESVS